ncbi:SET and MYND domain-containing protein 4 isoform X1 [Vespa velutina]|uniref:SET and MYND domain-containing protein 4 isoform X1 n=1 Tax=Vespa velutina TaxID=202808 RepID=UPI001FB353FB|nr:SET and MYND domain-containing protein 4 isoform X1 [Vespa velutina]XP_047368500.1 SET and MYND domain-containing protein 4 isoform X1 [Vespa velutina]XP_047368501.1 SET and MYND domain-containing protein 4 isoform X1 [Vespa velutina]XP_047368502.1 SET and MYND domain-containing protein 4 isoform X1 [Vespa velutina]XP_047368504.1 SET and MYND domain-containing protein 4 isoform X1 [Vespa velutina]XP_047368505.1 SET and MYND domain-containing protein 4 isoform X1 [Vespa velutina]XP_04736850
MEEEYYRNLCSSETLRSGKKGFFHDFTDYAINAVGDIWIEKIFGRIDNDVDRLKCIYTDEKLNDVIRGTLTNVKLLYRDKDANISRVKRLEGFQVAREGQHEKALLLFSQAILRAPITGKCKTVDRGYSLPLALLGRAESFMVLKEYRLAFEDLALAEDYGSPIESRTELERMKEECKRILEENAKSVVPYGSQEINDKPSDIKIRSYRETTIKRDLPLLSGGINSKLPSASALLEIRETKFAGKEAVATKDIYPGDCLVVEEPLAACLLPEFYGTHCQHCFSRLRAPIGCTECSTVAFCGRKCRDVAVSTYHKYECKILALLIGSGMSILSMVAYRMITQEGLIRCLKFYDIIEKKLIKENDKSMNTVIMDNEPKLSKSAKRRLRKKKLKDTSCRNDDNIISNENKSKGSTSNDPNMVDVRAYELTNHNTKRSASDFLERSLMAAFLLKCLQRVNFFEDTSRDDEIPNQKEIIVGSLLLKNLQLLQFNAHEFCETRVNANHRFRGSKSIYLGVAIYPTVARFNHDCYPAVTRYFVGRNIVIRAIRTLKPGDVVAENYGPIFTKRNLEERQRTLSGRYWFKCTCKACKDDWPLFERMTNDLAKLRCTTEGCNRLYRRKEITDKTIKCIGCQKSINLVERLNSLLECEVLYVQGLDKMEEEKPERAIELLVKAIKKFHEIAVPPHRDTHLAEIALGACMSDSGNTWRVA